MATAFFCLTVTLLVANLLSTGQADLTTSLIKHAGYPVETHFVDTIDGYRLKLHRIPSSRDKNKNTPQARDTVLLVHGLVNSAKTWVVTMEGSHQKRPPAMVLADAGLDVWLFNARGTEVSRHRTLTMSDKAFWDFTWHEIGNIDLPATIDYILKKTKRDKLRYVGYSQGCAVFSVLLSTRPQYNSKISSAHLIAPGVIMKGHSGLLKKFAELRHSIRNILNNLNIYAYMYNNPVSQTLNNVFCNELHLTSPLCIDVLYSVVGADSGQLRNKTELFKFLTGSVLDHASLKQLDHYGQIMNSGVFEQYDHADRHQKYQGIKKPRPYDLSLIQVPVTIMYGTKDGLVPVRGVKELTKKLRNVRAVTVLPWNHLDFLYGKNANRLIYKKIVDYIIQDSAK